MLTAGSATVISDHVVRLSLPRRSSTLYVQLDVTFLGARIMTSGLVFPWRPDPENRHQPPQLLLENPAANIAAAAVPAIGYTAVPSVAATPSRDATGSKSSDGSNRGGMPRDLLDSSDLVSLDLTVRGATNNSGGGGVLEAAANRLKASRPPSNLSKVVEEEASQISCSRGAVGAAILDNSTPFSPLSDRCPVSTLKDTVSTASRLQKALAIVESVDELPSLIHPDDKGKNHSNNVPPAAMNGDGHQLTFGNSMVDPEDSILRPSTSADRLSVEDMQRSLSREGSPNNTTAACGPEEEEGEGSMLTFMNPAVSVAERSISFAPTTTQVRCLRKRDAKFYFLFFLKSLSKSVRYRTYLPKRLLGSSVVDPHHCEADPDSNFCLMRVRIRLCTVMRIQIRIQILEKGSYP
jgi:hypothetical protein